MSSLFCSSGSESVEETQKSSGKAANESARDFCVYSTDSVVHKEPIQSLWVFQLCLQSLYVQTGVVLCNGRPTPSWSDIDIEGDVMCLKGLENQTFLMAWCRDIFTDLFTRSSTFVYNDSQSNQNGSTSQWQNKPKWITQRGNKAKSIPSWWGDKALKGSHFELISCSHEYFSRISTLLEGNSTVLAIRSAYNPP